MERLLEDRAALAKAVDECGRTPLHIACSMNAATIAELLVGKGAPLEEPDEVKAESQHRETLIGAEPFCVLAAVWAATHSRGVRRWLFGSPHRAARGGCGAECAGRGRDDAHAPRLQGTTATTAAMNLLLQESPLATDPTRILGGRYRYRRVAALRGRGARPWPPRTHRCGQRHRTLLRVRVGEGGARGFTG